MKTKIVFLCTALALVMSSGAAAQDTSGFYAGIGIGKAKAKLDNGDFTLTNFGPGSPVVSERQDDTNTTYKFFGGYQLNRFLGIELAYTDFGNFAYIYNATAVGLGTSRLDYRTSSTALSVTGLIPIKGGFSILGRAGVTYNRAERSAFVGDFVRVVPIPSATKTKASFLWGAGGQYDFTPTFAARLEYEDYGKFGEAITTLFSEEAGRARIHLWSVNLIARF